MISNLNSFYKYKKVLVTGHTGFKGSWLALWLTELGAQVIGYSLEPPTKPSMFEAIGLQNKLIHIIGDVRDEQHLLSVFNEYQPEIVFHLAAQPIVRLSYKEPRLTYETNIMGTVNLLETMRETKSTKVAIIITSDKCYENKEWVYGYREIDPMGGYDPYSSSKGCVELIVSAYRRSYLDNLGIALSSVRAGNVIGGGDWQEDRLIPDCIKTLSKKEKIKIRNPKAIRPWQFVLEPLSGYLLLALRMYEDRLKYNGAWNFGPSERNILTVEEITQKVIDYWGEGEYEIVKSSENFHEANLLKLDCSKAYSLLRWHSIYMVDEALKNTIEWYKKYYDGIRDRELCNFTVSQIIEYAQKGGY